MAVVGSAAEGLCAGARVAQSVSNWFVDGPKNVFGNIDPLSDLLKLIQRINEIVKPWIEMLPLQRISKAVSHITDFVNARNFIPRLSDIVSGRLAPLKELSKLAYLVGDFASTAKWLSSIEVLGSWVKDATAQFVSWGKEFNILKGIGDVSCLTGALLNISETVRLVIKEFTAEKYFAHGRLKLSLLVDHVVDLAYDVTKVAASVLSNIPGVHMVVTTISLAIGATLSLGKFFKKTYWIEEEAPEEPLASRGEPQCGDGCDEPLPEDFDVTVHDLDPIPLFTDGSATPQTVTPVVDNVVLNPLSMLPSVPTITTSYSH